MGYLACTLRKRGNPKSPPPAVPRMVGSTEEASTGMVGLLLALETFRFGREPRSCSCPPGVISCEKQLRFFAPTVGFVTLPFPLLLAKIVTPRTPGPADTDDLHRLRALGDPPQVEGPPVAPSSSGRRLLEHPDVAEWHRRRRCHVARLQQ